MHCFIFKFTLILNSVLAFCKLVFKFPLSILGLFYVQHLLFKQYCLDVLQLLMLFVRTLINVEPKWFLFIIFYNSTFIIIKILIEFNMNLYVLLPHYIMAALIELLLLSKRYQLSSFVCMCFVSFFCSCLLYNWALSC